MGDTHPCAQYSSHVCVCVCVCVCGLLPLFISAPFSSSVREFGSLYSLGATTLVGGSRNTVLGRILTDRGRRTKREEEDTPQPSWGGGGARGACHATYRYNRITPEMWGGGGCTFCAKSDAFSQRAVCHIGWGWVFSIEDAATEVFRNHGETILFLGVGVGACVFYFGLLWDGACGIQVHTLSWPGWCSCLKNASWFSCWSCSCLCTSIVCVVWKGFARREECVCVCAWLSLLLCSIPAQTRVRRSGKPAR